MADRDAKMTLPFMQRIFLVSGVIMLFDLAFFGAGLVLPGGLSLRRMLFAVMVAAAGLQRLSMRAAFTRSEIALVLLMLVLIALWTVVLPASYGFQVSQGVADVSPWAGLILLSIWPWDAWPRAEQWARFRRYFVVLAIILALVHIAIWTLLASSSQLAELLLAAAALVSTNGGDDSGSFINVGSAGNGLFRVYWSSSIFLMGGLYFLVAYRPARLTRGWIIGFLLICFALYTTYIRAFLASLALFWGLWLIFRPRSGSPPLLPPKFKVLMLWVLGIGSVCIAINPDVLALLRLARDASDTERVDQASALLGAFAAHPMLGTGFGSYVAQDIRSTVGNFSYELVFHALLMKVGIVGIVLLVVILGVALDVAGVAARARANPRMFAIWAAFTTGFWFAGATNPMVTNFVGMAIIVLLLVDMRHWTEPATAGS